MHRDYFKNRCKFGQLYEVSGKLCPMNGIVNLLLKVFLTELPNIVLGVQFLLQMYTMDSPNFVLDSLFSLSTWTLHIFA